jgi:glycerate kinase
MRILIAPDKFKGSLSAQEAATAIAEGWRAGSPANLDLEFSCRPVADGGEGTAKVICEALGGSWVEDCLRELSSSEANDSSGEYTCAPVILRWRVADARNEVLAGTQSRSRALP